MCGTSGHGTGASGGPARVNGMDHPQSTLLRAVDAITSFAGSMRFVCLHAVAFAAWMLLAESTPWPR